MVCYAVNFEKLKKRKSISMGFSNQCFFKQQTCCWVSVKFLSHDSFFLKKWLPDPNLFRDLRPTRKGNFLLIRRKFHKPIIPFGCTFGIEDYLNFLPRSISSFGGVKEMTGDYQFIEEAAATNSITDLHLRLTFFTIGQSCKDFSQYTDICKGENCGSAFLKGLTTTTDDGQWSAAAASV